MTREYNYTDPDPDRRTVGCSHTTHAICQACTAENMAKYYAEHPTLDDKIGRGDCGPDGHLFTPDDSGLTCVLCELPKANRRHKLGWVQ